MIARVARPGTAAPGPCDTDAAPVHGPNKADAAPVQTPCTPPEASPEPVQDPVAPGPWERASDTERDRALFRLSVVARSDALVASGMARGPADARAGKEAGVSASSVSGWRRRLRGVAAGARAAALLDGGRTGRPGRDWSDPGLDALWGHFVTDYLRLERPDATACWRRVRHIALSRGLDMPPLEAFLRRLRKEVPVPECVRGREGAVATMGLSPHVVRTVEGLGPLDIINGDGKKHDVLVRLPSGGTGRPIVWYWQDVMSRKILSYAAGEAETAAIVRTSLHEVIVEYGVPGKVVIDNTRAASSKTLTGGQKKRKRARSADPQAELPGTLKLLGIVYSSTAVDRDAAGRGVGRGRSKPIERAFGDLAHKIDTDPRLAGAYTGRSTQDRPETHRSHAAGWDVFLAVVADCVAEHNARTGRRTEAAWGRSFDEAFADAMGRAQVRRLGVEQAGLLLLDAERVRVARDGTIALSAGRSPGKPLNRHYDECLVERAGETLIARFDPDRLHDRIFLHDEDGRFVARARCLVPEGWVSKQAAQTYNRAARRTDKAARKALDARRDMSALAEELERAGPHRAAPPPEPAATRMVTGTGLPELPKGGRGDLPMAAPGIEANGGDGSAGPDTAPVPRQRGGSFMAALKQVQQLKDEEEGNP